MIESRHVIIGIDFSPAGLAAAREGRRMAGYAGRATAVHVLEPPRDLPLREAFAPGPGDSSRR